MYLLKGPLEKEKVNHVKNMHINPQSVIIGHDQVELVHKMFMMN